MANGMLEEDRQAPFSRAVIAVKRKMASFRDKSKKSKPKPAAKCVEKPSGLKAYLGAKK